MNIKTVAIDPLILLASLTVGSVIADVFTTVLSHAGYLPPWGGLLASIITAGFSGTTAAYYLLTRHHRTDSTVASVANRNSDEYR